MTSTLALKSVTRRFGKVTAVDALSMELREGELLAVLGPSGCGKTTTLRLIAGFERPDGGEVYFGDRPVSALPPERRDIGMVFQNYALFPHLTVWQNVAFGLQMRHLPRVEVARRTAEILGRVQLGGMEDRYPRQLSGGQQQRTALARALVINPQILLLDEPLANLDAKLREEMRFFIRSLQRDLGITALYVTHDQAEAMVLADRILVMMHGVVQQLDAPEAVYRRPATAEVASFVGLSNFLPGEVATSGGGLLSVQTPHGALLCQGPDLPAGAPVQVMVRPESIRPAAAPESGNHLAGVVVERSFLGNLTDYRIEAAGATVLRVQVGGASAWSVGEHVALGFEPADAWGIPDHG
ncbi:MAG TPA: ABC transporter ATP-binding protein [Bacillota bacterium]|nr:ABC transporter ATP-binding protein [Bacillota bacterium]